MAEGQLIDTKNMEKFYEKYDADFPNIVKIKDIFIWIMDFIGSIFTNTLAQSNFKRTTLFFSLYMTIYHMNYGLNDIKVARTKLTIHDIPRIRDFVSLIDSKLFDDKPSSDSEYVEFFKSISKATTDQRVKVIRTTYLCKELHKFLNSKD